MVPSVAAANTALLPTAGESPGAALPMLSCQAICGDTVALMSGRGPIFLLSPRSHPNDGAGIVGIHDRMVEQPPVHRSAAAAITVGMTRIPPGLLRRCNGTTCPVGLICEREV